MSALNHDERRRRIAEVVMDVIAREGLAAATVRRIASEVGFSTTIVTHYFTDKQDLLISAYRIMRDIGRERFDAAVGHDPADLVSFLMSMTAADDANLAHWRAYVAIWDSALRDEELATELRTRMDEGLGRIETFIKARNPDCRDPSRIARRLLALSQGLSVQRLFNPESWSKEALREAFATEVDLLLGK